MEGDRVSSETEVRPAAAGEAGGPPPGPRFAALDWALIVVLCVSSSLLSVAGYHRYFAPKVPCKVDIVGIVNGRTKAYMEGNVDPALAGRNMETFVEELSKAVREVPSGGGRVVLLTQAVVEGGEDVTEEVRAAVYKRVPLPKGDPLKQFYPNAKRPSPESGEGR